MIFHSLPRLTLSLTLAFCSAVSQAGYFDQREDVRAFVADVAARNQLKEKDLLDALADAEPLPKVVDLIKPPTQPGVRSWKRYRARFLDAPRISGGVKFWQEHRATLEEASAQTGVPAEIIVGIIGVETIYGRNMGNFSALSALATLAFDYPPRAELFRRELEALFLLARDQGHPVQSYLGSYAGALGLPQFLPSSLRNFALDGDGDGLINLRSSPKDAIFSVANFLAIHGWQKGGRVVLPTHLQDPAIDFSPLVQAGIEPRLDAQTLARYGISTEIPLDEQDRFTLVDFITPDEPTQYWLGLQNFYVITRYNRSSFYAMSVVDLGRTVRLALEAHQEMGKLSEPPKSRRKGRK